MNSLLNLIFGIIYQRWQKQHLWSLKLQLPKLYLCEIGEPNDLIFVAIRYVFNLLIIVSSNVAVFFLRLFHIFKETDFFFDIFIFLEDLLLQVFREVFSAHVHFEDRMRQRKTFVNRYRVGNSVA